MAELEDKAEDRGDDLPPHTDADNKSAKPAEEAADDDEALQGSVINFAQFNSNFTAPGAMFGMGGQQAAGRRATGWLDAAEIDAALESFVHPRPCFDRAAEALDKDRVVVLTAPSGSGKRSGALALIRGFAESEEDACVVLSPESTLEDLAKRKFTAGLGYVLLDRMNEAVAQPDFAWRLVRDRLRARGAYLVVTTVHELAVKPETVRHIDWRMPEPKQVLENRLRGCEPALIDRALATMPSECVLRDVVAVADLIVSEVDPEEAWERHGGNAVQVVRGWFDEGRTLSDYTAITTLAFAVGSNQRTFETLQQHLADRLAPDPEPPAASEVSADEQEEAKPAPGPLYKGRRELKGNPLVTRQNLAVGAINRSVLVFAEPRYRQWVLEELWETCPTPFWDAVRDWLTDVVAGNTDPQLEFAIATGLAHLARSTFDEVVDSYLDPWAVGLAGPAGKALAVQVLWCMCLDEELASAALSVAHRWIDSSGLGAPARRSAAIVAFGGMLGVRFPSDAVRRLWKQVERGPVSGEAGERLAYLFAALVECDEDAGVVTQLLKHRLRKQRQAVATDALKRSTFLTVLGLVEFRDWLSDEPVCAVALARQPALTSHLADLFAGVLVNRLYRTEGKDALMKVVKALPAVCTEPEEVARRFGRALGTALPPAERQPLVAVLRNRRDTHNDIPTGAFLSAVLISEDETEHG